MELDFNIFKIEYNKVKPRKGSILVSEPFLQDAYFKRSLVLLAEHSAEGSVGFVLNKPVKITVNEIVADFPKSGFHVSMGGPVSHNTLYYFHTLGDKIPNSFHIFDNIWWGGDFQIIKEMVVNGQISIDDLRFFLGYSGWTGNQLEEELEQNSWVVTTVPATEIMSPESCEWKSTLSRLGIKYQIWSTFPENPGNN